MSESDKRPDIELTHGSLGEGQPNFTVFVSDVVNPDQVEQIAMFMKQGADDMRAMLAKASTEECNPDGHTTEGWCPACD